MLPALSEDGFWPPLFPSVPSQRFPVAFVFAPAWVTAHGQLCLHVLYGPPSCCPERPRVPGAGARPSQAAPPYAPVSRGERSIQLCIPVNTDGWALGSSWGGDLQLTSVAAGCDEVPPQASLCQLGDAATPLSWSLVPGVGQVMKQRVQVGVVGGPRPFNVEVTEPGSGPGWLPGLQHGKDPKITCSCSVAVTPSLPGGSQPSLQWVTLIPPQRGSLPPECGA